MHVFNCLISFNFQVQFMNVSTVFAIQTQGRAGWDQWVSTYRVEYSQDCSTFNNLLDVDGNNQVRTIFIVLKVFFPSNQNVNHILFPPNCGSVYLMLKLFIQGV